MLVEMVGATLVLTAWDYLRMVACIGQTHAFMGVGTISLIWWSSHLYCCLCFFYLTVFFFFFFLNF